MENLGNNKKPKTFNLELFGFSLFKIYYTSTLGWVRVLGIGLHWKNTSKHKMYFSERNGFKKGFLIGNYRISMLQFNKF